MDKKWPFGFFVYSNIGDEEGTEPVTDAAVAEEAPVEEAETVEDVVEAAESEAVEEAPVEAAETIEEAIEEVVEEPAQTEETISSADEEDDEEDDNEDQEDFLEEDEILDSKIVLPVEDLPTFDFSDVDLALEEDDFASEEESDERDERDERDENEDNDAFMDEEDADFPALEEELEIALEAAHKKQQKKNRLITGISAGVALLGVAGLATGLAIHSYFKKK